MKILIIDDSPDALAIAKRRLMTECSDVICAQDGASGLMAAKKESPDLILLDVDMPNLSGFEVCQRLKADPDLCMIPVLFLSGSNTPEDKVHGLDLGAVDYIAKPFDVFELQARVRAALRTKKLQDLLIEHANIDPLTGLPNRRALMDRLGQEWARIARHGGRLSFIMADIDHFKNVNDTYGHTMGDRLLQEVAKIFAKECRNVDMPARYGGEEFAIIVPNETITDSVKLAERCRREIEKMSLSLNRRSIGVTVSFGVAEALDMSDIEDLIKKADAALYQAKQNGRNLVKYEAPHAQTPTMNSDDFHPTELLENK